MRPTRRQLLGQACGLGMTLGGALFAARLGAQTPSPSCFDPATLPYMQKSRRRALGYMDASTNPAKRCGLCAFFTSTSGSCGNCQMLSGGPVAASALCNSFAPRAVK